MQIPQLDFSQVPTFKSTGKAKTSRKRWNKNYVLINVQFPKEVKDRGKVKLFKNSVIYLDQKGKRRKKNIMYGDKTDYIFNHNQDLRIKRFDRLTKKDDPFHPNFHRLHFCNAQKTIGQAYSAFQRKLGQIKQKTMNYNPNEQQPQKQ